MQGARSSFQKRPNRLSKEAKCKNKKKPNSVFCIYRLKFKMKNKKKSSLSIGVQNLYFCPQFKVKTIAELANNKNSNILAPKLQIFKKIH